MGFGRSRATGRRRFPCKPHDCAINTPCVSLVGMFRSRPRPTRLTARDHSPEYALEIANLIDAQQLQVLADLRADLEAGQSIRRAYKAWQRGIRRAN